MYTRINDLMQESRSLCEMYTRIINYVQEGTEKLSHLRKGSTIGFGLKSDGYDEDWN